METTFHELLVYAIIALLGVSKSLNAFRIFQAKRNGKLPPGNPSHEVIKTKLDTLTGTCNRIEADFITHTTWARERDTSVGQSLARLGERIARIEGPTPPRSGS